MKILFQKLWPELVHFRHRLAIVVVCGVISGACEGLFPGFIQRLTGAWNVTPPDLDTAYFWAAVIPVLWIGNKFFEYIFRFWMKYIGDLIAIRQRQRLMEKYLSFDIQYLNRLERGSGGLISRMVNDIMIFQDGMNNLATLSKDLVKMTFAIYYIFSSSWMLAVMVLIAMPVIMAILKNLARSIRKYSHQNQQAMEDITKTLKESLDGARVIQSFNLEPYIKTKFATQSELLLSFKKKVIQREEASGPVSESVTVVMVGLIFAYLTYLVGQGQFSTSQFVGFGAAATIVADALRRLRETYIKLQQAVVSLKRLNEIMSVESGLPKAASPKKFPANWKTLEFRDVSFRFDDKTVLDHINLTIRRGEVVAFVGASGSGKTTLVNLLPRFADPVSGEILIDGISLKDFDLVDLRQHVALVNQDVFLFADTIENNIWLANQERSRSDIQNVASMANAHDFVSRTENGYQTVLGDYGARLSGGEKQRISIARALFKDAPILILDEATSALDTVSELEVKRGIDQLIKGRTALVIAHRLSTITSADRIIVMKNGRIVEEGSHQELLDKKGDYHGYFQLQIDPNR